MRVMVIEDFKTMRRILRSLLEQMGFEVVYECDGIEQALSHLQDDTPDLIICDQTLADGSAADFLKRLSGADHQALAILLMGSESEKTHLQDALKIGADGFLLKPFTIGSLGEKINKIGTAKRAS